MIQHPIASAGTKTARFIHHDHRSAMALGCDDITLKGSAQHDIDHSTPLQFAIVNATPQEPDKAIGRYGVMIC